MSTHKDESIWNQLNCNLEDLIVKGQHEEGRQILRKTNPKKIPRTWAVQFAELAFRLNAPLDSLIILQSIIYPESPFSQSPPSAKEKVIYATALSSLGATNESIKILDQIDVNTEPEALFHQASACIYSWNYSASIPYLKKYIASKKITPYKRLVGRVNLAAAQIHLGDWTAARELLLEIQAECEINSYHLLLGNCYELQGQIEIFQQRYEQALNLLDKAMIYLKPQGGLYSLYAEKWMIICQCMRSSDPSHLEKLDALRMKAFELRHWNTMRECDLFESIAKKDENLIKKVIMGTPSELYRQRARKHFGVHIIAKGQYNLYIGPIERKAETHIEFDPYKKGTQREALYEKPLLLNLFEALTEDFYQPFTLGLLFQKIYPQERFNPFSSPPRVLQLLRRLNHWFKENSVPLKVEFKKSEFKLISPTGVWVLMQRGTKLSSTDGKIATLKDHFRDKSFSIGKASEALGVSKATTERLLKTAFDQGKVFKIGQGPSVSYRLALHGARKKVA